MFLSQTSHLFQDSTSLLQDRKFDTALRATTISAFLRRKDEEHHWSDDLIWTHYPKDTKFLSDTTLLPYLIIWLFDRYNQDLRARPTDWQKMWNLIRENMTIQHNWAHCGVDKKVLPENLTISEFLQKVDNFPELSNLIVALDDLTQLINHLPKINEYLPNVRDSEKLVEEKSKVNRYQCPNIPLKATWSNKMCVLEWNRTKWLLPKPYILQIHNKLADIISILLHAKLSSGVNHSPEYYGRIFSTITELCRLHIRFPAAFFDFANSFEGLCTAKLLKSTDDWVNDSLWKNLVQEITDMFFLDPLELDIFRILDTCPIDEIMELGCLTKVTGHPLTDTKAGMEKLHSRVQETFDVSTQAVGFCICAFKENYIRNFILRHKRWPSCEFDHTTAHKAFTHCMPRGLDPCSEEIERKYGRVTWEDWSCIELRQEIKFNFCENVIPLLKDKALSVLRSKVVNTYLNKDFDPKTCPPMEKVKFEDTRVLLHYLFTDDKETDHIAYIKKFLQTEEDLSPILDYLVIRLVPKEKELKTKARFFGCKPFVDRARTIVQEQNVMTFLNLFSDEQGMTLSELAIMKKLYSMQNLNHLYKTHKVFKANIDAEAWNTKHREETQRAFHQQTLDKIFGLPIFSRTHTAYRHSLAYAPDEEGIYWWDGQLGGIEGLNQCTWVLTYIFQMKYAFRNTPYKFFQLIHGDDYRVVIAVPFSAIPEGGEADIINDIQSRIAEAATMFGHKIKVKESYASEHILIYSKIVYYHTLQLTSALRKIQKTYGATNAFLPILDDYIGSSFSNAHSTCYTDTSHYASYIVALFWSYYYLVRDKHYKELSHDDLLSLLLIPSTVGGLPMIYLHNFFVRGESDLLTAFVHLTQYCMRYYPRVATKMMHFINIPFSQKIPYALLLKDPYSLPIKKPPSITLYLKQIVRNRLSRTIRNIKVRDLLMMYSKESLGVLIDDLVSSNEWQAKPFTALYSNSPYHLIDELLSSFVTAKSIRDLLITSSKNVRQSQRIIVNAMKKDHKLQIWRLKTLKGENITQVHNLTQDMCPAAFCSYWRNMAWRIQVTTITHPPPQHQVYVSTQKEKSNDLWALDNHFVFTVNVPKFLLGTSWHYADGGKTPFLGHTTTAGTITPTIKVSEKDPIASKVSNLLTLRSWMNKTQDGVDGPVVSNFPQYTDHILKSFTDTPANDLQKFAPAWKSGSITHRLRAHGFRESVVPNNLLNWYTLITGETNTHRHFRDTREDFTVNYLHLFCFATCVIFKDLEMSSTYRGPNQLWLITTPCAHCNTPIVEPPIIIERVNYLMSAIPPLLITTLGQASTELIQMAQQEYDLQYPALGPQDEEVPLEAARMITIYECLKKAWSERLSLSRRYGVHDMTAKGLGLLSGLTSLTTDKTLGETELRALPLQNMVDCLATYILSFVLKEMPGAYTENVSARMNTVVPHALPWYTILEWYYKSGLLRQLIKVVSDMTDVPCHEGCFYNVNTATIYVGKALWTYATITPVSFPYLCGTAYDTAETVYNRYLSLYHRELYTDMKNRHHECKHIYEEIRRTNAKLTPDQEQHILEGYITYSRNPNSPEIMAQQDAGTTGFQILFIHGMEMYTEEEFNRWDEDPRPGVIKHFDWLHAGYLLQVLSRVEPEDLERLVEEENPIPTEYYLVRYPIGACIDRIRSNPHYEDKRITEENLDHGMPSVDIMCPENIPDNEYICAIPVLRDLPVEHHQFRELGEFLEKDFNNFAWSCISRVLGASISSCNKFHYILSLLGLTNMVRQEGWICCCAEGEGGTLHHLLSICPRVQAVFNTYVDDMRSGASAGICDRDPGTRYRYTKVPLLQGVFDLTKTSTIDTYCAEYPHQFWLFTCDADIRTSDRDDIVKLWTNVTLWWLRTRTRNSVFILKVFYHHLIEVSRILTLLSYYCLYVKLVRVPLSHINTEMYIVAYGTSKPYIPLCNQELFSHPLVYESIYRFCTDHMRLYNFRCQNFDPDYYTEMRDLTNIMARDYIPEQKLMVYIITQKMRLRMLGNYRDITLSVRSINKWVLKSIEIEKDDLRKRILDNKSEIHAEFQAHRTLKHYEIMIMRWLYLSMYEALLSEWVLEAVMEGQQCGAAPREYTEPLFETLEEFSTLLPLFMGADRRTLHLGPIYNIDLLQIIHHASGTAFQLLGCFVAHHRYQREQNYNIREINLDGQDEEELLMRDLDQYMGYQDIDIPDEVLRRLP